VAQYDTIIIGAGHNGLVCANYLARKGQKVLVLESAQTCGGLAARREFHPGFHAAAAHTMGHFSQRIASDLELSRYGFDVKANPLTNVGLNLNGDHVVDEGHSLSGSSEKDQLSFQQYRQLMQRFSEMLAPFWLKTVPRIGDNSLSELFSFAQLGLKLRMLGKADMQEFMRMVSLPMQDLMDEYFDAELVKATLCWDGLIGSKQAPRTPNNSVLLMLYRMSGIHKGQHQIPTGRVTGLVSSLKESAESAGVEIRTGSRVDKIIIDQSTSGLEATGVRLDDSEELSARRVASSADPKTTFLKLVGAQNLEIEFTNRIRRIRSDGYVAKLHLALSALPEFSGLESVDGRLIIAPNMAAIESAFDDAKYGACPDEPVMEIVIPSLHDPSLAPAGQHVLSAHVMYVPYKLKTGWDEPAREAFSARVVDTIARYAPNIREQIIAAELLTPLDLEKTYNVRGGHWHHAEFALDQLFMMRPTYGAAQYRTPIEDLFLCGAGCHPGGGIMGGAGHNAAKEILS
jgi:phytoene dehydrogenase-like protein